MVVSPAWESSWSALDPELVAGDVSDDDRSDLAVLDLAVPDASGEASAPASSS